MMTISAQSQKTISLQMYQIFVGRWESANIRDHKGRVFTSLAKMPFERLKAIGIDTLYLLGVFDNRGPILVEEEEGDNLESRHDRCPSIFAISDHQNTNPLLGKKSELKELIKTLHKKDFKVVLDFVPNHTSTNHSWIKAHPDYYHQNESGLMREFSGDVYKLNYNNTSLRSEMETVLKTLVSWGADGVRCDMAHLIPIEFWQSAITIIKKKHPKFIFIAESYESSIFDWSNTQKLIDVGFDLVYHHALYENLKTALTRDKRIEYLESHVDFVKKNPNLGDHLLNYLSNHDDSFPGNRQDIPIMRDRLKGLPGSWLTYNGIINGRTTRLAHHYLDTLPNEQNELMTLIKTEKFPSINNKTDEFTLALDIGGSKIESALVNENFQTSQIRKVATEKSGFGNFITQLLEIINSYLQENNAISALSIAVPGILDEKGKIEFAGGNLHFLNQKNIKTTLEKECTLPITIENDSNCFALGEALYGAGKNHRTVVGITWGTGIGAGIVIDQKLFKGSGGAGEIGHIPVTTTNQSILCGCGKANCLEVYASGAAIQNQYAELGGSIPNAKVVDIVNSQEMIAIAIIDQAVIFLAEAIVAVVNLLSPDCIVIGGGISQIDARVFMKLEKLVADQEIKSIHQTKIVKHELGNAALVGAAILRESTQ